MLDKNIKPKWWFPIVLLFVPGSCYVYSAYYPSFQMVFALIGIALTVGIISMAIIRVSLPQRTATYAFMMVIAQSFIFWSLLISYRFWSTLFPQASLGVFLTLLIIYLLAWLAPFFWPSQSQFLYRYFWYTKQPIFTIVILLAGIAGAYCLKIGSDWLEYGRSEQLFAAIMSIIIFVVSSFYFSVSLWRQQQGKSSIPVESLPMEKALR